MKQSTTHPRPVIGGDATRIDALGFQNMAPFADGLTLYDAGTLTNPVTYFADGAGNVTVDFVNPSTDELDHTTGGVLTAGADSTLLIESGL